MNASDVLCALSSLGSAFSRVVQNADAFEVPFAHTLPLRLQIRRLPKVRISLKNRAGSQKKATLIPFPFLHNHPHHSARLLFVSLEILRFHISQNFYPRFQMNTRSIELQESSRLRPLIRRCVTVSLFTTNV